MRYARARRRRRELTTYLPHLREKIRKRVKQRSEERQRGEEGERVVSVILF